MSVLLKPFAKVHGRSNAALRFYKADCLDVFRQLPSQSVDVIVTSPPYNLGIGYGTVSRYALALRVSGVDEHAGWPRPLACSPPAAPCS